MAYVLTPENYDGVTSALIGNGELCTAVGPTGFHTPPQEWTDPAHRTQHFVLAGRRRSGPHHPLINFGALTQRVLVGGNTIRVEDWRQELLPMFGHTGPNLGAYSVGFYAHLIS